MAEKCKKAAKGYTANPTKQAIRKQARMLQHIKRNPFDDAALGTFHARYKRVVVWADLNSKGRKVNRRRHIVEAKRLAKREAYWAGVEARIQAAREAAAQEPQVSAA